MTVREICSLFKVGGKYLGCKSIHTGNINFTYEVRFKEDGEEKKYVIQRINKNVFKNPPELMDNYVSVTEFLKKIIIKNGVMIAFFISNPLSQYYRSDKFAKILENVSLNPKLFELKQNDNKLRIFSRNVDGISKAYSILKKL